MKIELKHISPYLPYGLKWLYNSYDHKKAVIEHNESCEYTTRSPNCHYISDELKIKYLVKRIGRIHGIQMRKHGWVFKIGNKYPKTYYQSEIGIDVKPILRPLSDLRTTKLFDNYGNEKLTAVEEFEGNWDLSPLDWVLLEVSKGKQIERLLELNYLVIEEIISHHFDVFGLIDQGLAVDINTV